MDEIYVHHLDVSDNLLILFLHGCILDDWLLVVSLWNVHLVSIHTSTPRIKVGWIMFSFSALKTCIYLTVALGKFQVSCAFDITFVNL